MSGLDNYSSEESIPSIEELLTENVEQAELIQRLLSEKSELQQIVQEQQLTLQEMKEKIVSLNNSDLQLKEAEQKLTESELKLAEAIKLEKATREADRNRKRLYEKSVRELSLKESNAIKREKDAKNIIDFQDKVLNEKAKQMTASVRASLEKRYQRREKALCKTYRSRELQLHVLTVGGLIYSFYVTALAVITTVRFKSDFKAFFKVICSIMVWIWENLLIGANTASNLCKNIPNEVVASVISWLMYRMIVLLVLAIIVVGVGWCAYRICQFYDDNFADRLSVAVTLISFSLLVWFGDYVGNVIKCNLVLIFIIIQVVYIIIRMYLDNRSY